MSRTFNAVELFCGAGGMALGLERAGFQIDFVVDKDKDCIKTIEKNSVKGPRGLWCNKTCEIKDLHPRPTNLDLLSAGFPCQPFSYAGKGLGFADIRGTAFHDLIKFIEIVRPNMIVAENVKGLKTHDSGKTIKTIISELQRVGYAVDIRLLNAVDFEVPQKRERLFIFAMKSNGLRKMFSYPEKVNKVLTLKDALENCPSSAGYNYSQMTKDVLDLVPPGGCWKDLPSKIQQSYMGASYYSGGGKTGIAKRLSWEKPSPTILCSPVQKQTQRCHPDITRPLTIRECARIQTFPDDWDFQGSMASQYRQIGNAVPVMLGYHVGLSLKKTLEANFP